MSSVSYKSYPLFGIDFCKKCYGHKLRVGNILKAVITNKTYLFPVLAVNEVRMLWEHLVCTRGRHVLTIEFECHIERYSPKQDHITFYSYLIEDRSHPWSRYPYRIHVGPEFCLLEIYPHTTVPIYGEREGFYMYMEHVHKWITKSGGRAFRETYHKVDIMALKRTLYSPFMKLVPSSTVAAGHTATVPSHVFVEVMREHTAIKAMLSTTVTPHLNKFRYKKNLNMSSLRATRMFWSDIIIKEV